ncbi:MAG: 1,4-dihydroxy-2-naphthoate polyprenyltransferase [Bryobacteraceae bacterium]
MIGTAVAWKATRQLDWTLFVAMLVASILIQAATNTFNEYFDHVSGLDNADSMGIAGVITQDRVPPKMVFYIAVATFATAMLLGVYICARSSWWLAPIGAACMLVGYLYNGGPIPISATPFGEIFAGGVMGTGIILLASFIQQKAVHLDDVLISIPVTVLIGCILTSNNIRDLENDRENGRRTLAIYLGHKWAVRFLAFSLFFANLWVVLLVRLGIVSAWAFLAFGSLWPAYLAIRKFRGERTIPDMMTGLMHVAQTNTAFGILFLVGLLVGAA